MQYLHEIVAQTGSKIVISSAWSREKTLEELQDIFRYYNLDSSCVIGKIFRINDFIKKEEAINFYLNEHPYIDKYVVVDDDFISVANLIQVRFDDGITEEIKDKIITMLNK